MGLDGDESGKEGLGTPQVQSRIALDSPDLEVHPFRLLDKSSESDSRKKHFSSLCFRKKRDLCALNGRSIQVDD